MKTAPQGKAAAATRTTTTKADAKAYLAGYNPGSRLMSASLEIGWRLAIAVLIPIFIGVKLDQHFDSAPSLTLSGFFIAIFIAGLLIRDAFTAIQNQTPGDTPAAPATKRRRNVK